ncbi:MULTISPECIES: AraC family transcriptional regulator [Sphingobacterium]|uniref:Transcriptional regulator n=3 Tax=Sphingobacteriaceae TaxID=84566 RepID=A0A654DSS2_SPHMU|nr:MULTISPECIES: AraC family transcriptional regulator [Sphingobacterium]HAE68502.1 AraC family transcriptional regulator [Sphingobacterium sp.]HCX62898.1 AraC family transcriptional regulator [Clostridiales bacterium]OFV12197.1 transcriptional regulator [Sphingobacterium sp. HMSC13C05]QQT46986.1 helix-turn-helix domain-containing protein [Sphingobacterium multivorum]QQT64545.1 helix-turn-helix domain-containing protein [Sphingobacterium multivorum]
MSHHPIKEVTPLRETECFTVFHRIKDKFDFPYHYHEEYELNMILNASGAQRVVGDRIEEIGDYELVLTGPNLPHGWFNNNCRSKNIVEVTVQWNKDLFSDQFLNKNQLNFIKRMLQVSSFGIKFSKSTIKSIAPEILNLHKTVGFDSVIKLMLILRDLSVSKDTELLVEGDMLLDKSLNFRSRRLDVAFDYMNKNFSKLISLNDVAELVNMSEVSFSRFIKKRTGKTFIDNLNEIRLGHATRMLIETSNTVAEICYLCGFNNISNFNRAFKRKKNCTPSAYRLNFSGSRVFI